NLPAREAVLRDVRAANVDQIVVGGDVLPGPMPRETLDVLFTLDLPATFITGNGEVAVLAERAGRTSGVPPQYRSMIQWVGGQLFHGDVRRVAARARNARGGAGVVFSAPPPNRDG